MNKFSVVYASCCMISCLYLASTPVHANPTGGQVITGSATIEHNNKLLTIQQNTAKAIIEWDSFNIEKNEKTHFQQPDKNSITLNRILDTNPSTIFGNLSATGQVMLINGNGLIFGADSKIDLPGFVASTLDINNDNFLNENYEFSSNHLGASLTQLGKINIADGGYAALLSPEIYNGGSITANLGTIAMAAGDAVTLNLTGDDIVSFKLNPDVQHAIATINHQGHIVANGGKVLLSANNVDQMIKGVINMDGVIEAKTIAEINGEIILAASEINLNSAELNVDATNAHAGTIRLAAEDSLRIDKDSRLSAQGLAQANGGFVALAAGQSYQVDGEIIIDSLSGDGGWLYTGDDTGLAKFIENPNYLREVSISDNGTYRLSFEYYDESGQFASKGINLKTIVGKDDTYFALFDQNNQVFWTKKSFINTSAESSIIGEQQGAGFSNYLIGNKLDWVTGVKHYKRVLRKNIYDGIDLVYYGNTQSDLEYDIKVNPGADYQQVKFRFDDADSISITEQGHLKITYGDLVLIQRRPVAYQQSGANKTIIASQYHLDENNNISFMLGNYDTSKELIIDPVVSDSNFGAINLGSADETLSSFGDNVAYDNFGNTYIAGTTQSADFLITPGAFQSTFANQKGFVTKIDSKGQVVSSTFVGGNGFNDRLTAMRLDAHGNIYVMGTTDSSQATFAGGGLADAFQTGCIGCTRGYYLKLNNSATTLLNGASIEDDPAEFIGEILDFVVNSNGDITYVLDFGGNVFTPTGICPFNNGCAAIAGPLVLSMIDANNNGVLAQTMTGTNTMEAVYMDIDGNDTLYMTTKGTSGFTGIDSRYVDYRTDLFADSAAILKLTKNNNSYTPAFLAMIGGDNTDTPLDIDVDQYHNIYIVGQSISTNYPTTADAYQSSKQGNSDGFITVFDSSNNLVYSTYYGFGATVGFNDRIDRISVTDGGRMVVAGVIDSGAVPFMNFTTEKTLSTYEALLTSYPGGTRSNYLTMFDKSRNSVIYHSLVGTADDDPRVRGLHTQGSLDSIGSLKINFVASADTGADEYQNIKLFEFKNTAATLVDETNDAIEAAISQVKCIEYFML